MPDLLQSAGIPNELFASLQGAGWDVQLKVDVLGGERDTRLCICVPAQELEVELLGRMACQPAPSRWHAVRVDAGGRCVWEGPSRRSSHAVVCQFLLELIASDAGRLSRRWRRLG